MGINTQGSGTNQRNFSSHVLKIELSGPTRSHFAILDVPGIFENMLRGTTETEMDAVTDMVTSYMRQEKNIIM